MAQDSTLLAATLALDVPGARIDVQCLLQHLLNVSRAYLLAYPERVLDEAEQLRYAELLQRRLNGEPIAYIVGEREFFGLMLQVTQATLIPRPETELLVELALQEIPETTSISSAQDPAFRVLDLGTGSGAIALAIGAHRPTAQIVACDASGPALAVARANAQRLGIANVIFLPSNWYAGLDQQQFDLIIANPPYVAAGDPHLDHGDLRFEPLTALVAGSDGLADICHIVGQAKAHLRSGGRLLLEHGYDQAEAVRDLLRRADFTAVFSASDLAGIERVSGGRA
ncbi:MAG: peptide chain release factor N(5)-glutamine methyltransferase [Pseudomonadota bacterium]